MKSSFVYFIESAFILTLLSCGPSEMVRTDLDSLNEMPEKYQDKEIILITDIKTLYENPEPYHNKKIEVEGYVERGSRTDIYWGFNLKDEDRRTVHCYEREYRHVVWDVPEMAIRRAERKNEQVRVIGWFKEGMKIQLHWFEYENQTIHTNYLPPTSLGRMAR